MCFGSQSCCHVTAGLIIMTMNETILLTAPAFIENIKTFQVLRRRLYLWTTPLLHSSFSSSFTFNLFIIDTFTMFSLYYYCYYYRFLMSCKRMQYWLDITVYTVVMWSVLGDRFIYVCWLLCRSHLCIFILYR